MTFCDPFVLTHSQQELQQAKNAYASVGGVLEEDQEAKRDRELLQRFVLGFDSFTRDLSLTLVLSL